MATAKKILDTRKVKSDGTYPIIIRINHNRDASSIATGFSCTIEQWDERNLEIKKSKGYDSPTNHNLKVTELLVTAKKYIEDNTGRINSLSCRQLRDEIRGHIPGKEKKTYISLQEGVLMYVSFLRNEDVPEHQSRQRNSRYLSELERVFNFMTDHIPGDTALENVSEIHVGRYYKAVMERKAKDGGKITSYTFNFYIRAARQFYNYFIEKKHYKCHNPFNSIEMRRSKTKPQMLYLEEFHEVLKKIDTGYTSKELEYQAKGIGTRYERRNYYRPWLKHGLILSLYGGGRRREEIAQLRWSSVIPNDDKLVGGILYYRNLKVERQSNIQFDDEFLPIEIPITKQLADLLIEMGWEEKKKTAEYILSPDTQVRNTVMEALTKGFQHYYKQTKNPRPGISFKSIRKTYITYTKAILADRAKDITGHTTTRMIEDHYEDKKLLREKLVNELTF